MWHNLNVHTRILLGYGLILGLTAFLALVLAFRINILNTQITQLNASVAFEADASALLAARVASTQQLIDRYLQRPQPDNLQAAQDALQNLEDEIAQIRDRVTSPTQQPRLDTLVDQVTTYRGTFETLSTLMDEQSAIRTSLSTQLFAASTSMHSAIATSLVDDTVAITSTDELTQAQRSLLLVNLWAVDVTGDNVDEQGQNMVRELEQTRETLSRSTLAFDQTNDAAVDRPLGDITRAVSSTEALVQNLQQTHQQRTILLSEQGEQLRQHVDAIAQDAFVTLIGAAEDLEQQAQQTQQIVVAVLLGTLVIAVVAGRQLARTITQPLGELVAATERLHQGDYSAIVSERDGSELGQLALAFNQMTRTLGQQREAVLRQQEDLMRRNLELERALEQIKTTTAARDALAATVRRLSVPVISILHRVIVVPLVGEIDEGRAHLLMERLLAGIMEQQAHIAILDITGVPFVTNVTADWLLRTASAAQMLGTQCILVGIRPEVAQALVDSGADLAGFKTKADLRGAVEYAMRVIMR